MKLALQIVGSIFMIVVLGVFVHQLRKGSGGPRPPNAALKQVIVDATKGVPGVLAGQPSVVDRGSAVYVSQHFKSTDFNAHVHIEENLVRSGWKKAATSGTGELFCKRPMMVDVVRETGVGNEGTFFLRSYWGDFPIYCPTNGAESIVTDSLVD